MVEIKGFIENTMLDYPGKIAAVIFLGGCNWRCPFCQNPALVVNPNQEPTIPQEDVFKRLSSPQLKKWVDAICVTGGEPTINPDLPQLMAKIKNLGYLVKLDTNGSHPKMLEELFTKKLVDYVAMDIKTSPENYEKACGTPIDMTAINNSVRLIRESGVDYEFRATVVPGFFSKQDAASIGKWLSGSKKFCIQQFRSVETLNPALKGTGHFHTSALYEFAEILKPFFEKVEVRGA